MVNKLGMKGEFTDICETRTGKQNVLSLSTIVLYGRERQGMYGMQHFCTPRNPPHDKL